MKFRIIAMLIVVVITAGLVALFGGNSNSGYSSTPSTNNPDFSGDAINSMRSQ